MPSRSKIYQETHLKKVKLVYKQKVTLIQNELKETANLHIQLINEENLRFLINERSIMLSQKVEKLKTSKKKLKKYAEKLQETVEELGRENYYLEREGRY